MGLLKLLFGSNNHSSVSEKYYVYKTKAEKYRAFAGEIQQLLNEKKKVAVIYIDNSIREEVEKVLKAISVSYNENASVLSQENEVLINSYDYSLRHPLSSEFEIRIADCHPHRSKNVALAESLKDHSPLIVYTSLDNPMFQALGSERIVQLMEQLGMKENERIEHALVTKSIIRAQEKLELKETGR